MNAVFKPHPNLRQFVATIAKMSTGYARSQANITKGLRRKKTCAPRIDLPPAPDLTDFVVPPASDDEDVREDSHSLSESLCNEVQEGFFNGDLASDDAVPNNGESTEDLEQEITENADTYDFSLDLVIPSPTATVRQTTDVKDLHSVNSSIYFFLYLVMVISCLFGCLT
ncbi:hypothetical protein PHMEG_00041895 [Phytophthora megakarya]|uniref:Uncharacterized protein n=1 Tax=Phytophthora megakarya TaxID=4795 RepID=A0A225UAZ8_9STRA|nr:hypothetical protein PHMEG_00041895 [Phytophthora megakarya]